MSILMESLPLDQFLEKAAQALGGRERIASVQTYAQEARITLRRAEGPSQGMMKLFRARGGKIRIEERLDVPPPSILIVNGAEGWICKERIEGQPPCVVPMTLSEIETIRRNAICSPRNLIAHAREYTIRGPASVAADRAGWRIVVDELEGEYLFDAESLLCLELVDRRDQRRFRYRAYHPCDGIQMPWSIEIVDPNGIRRIEEILSARYNLPLDESLFQPPE